MTPHVGVVGYGRWGANVVRDLVVLDARVALAEPDAHRRDRGAAAGAERTVAEAAQLPECDGYIVVTPAHTHREVCEELLGRGAPVFVEKPPCTTVNDVETLATAFPGRWFVMHKWRYHPGIRVLAELVKAGRLGAPTRLDTVRVGPEPLPADVDVLWHLGTHDLSIAIEILGSLAPVRTVQASRDLSDRITRCRATMAGDDGPRHEMTLAAGAADRVRKVVVEGTEASAVLARPDARTVSLHANGGVEHFALSPELPLLEELRAFVTHLGGGPPPVSDATTALAIAEHLAEMQRVASAAPA